MTSASDLIGLRRAGYHAFLIGGAFMCRDVPGEALADLLRNVHKEMAVRAMVQVKVCGITRGLMRWRLCR
ncbi:MAG: hypothetical protein CM1200mP25_4430 [Acidobacteriota bacterium]|nr:MAG: hypothetical protein CM1200mP25_4430 [Acidobacteriota bacterium]